MLGLKVLIVDDDPVTRRMLEVWVSKEPWVREIAVAENGVDALDLIGKKQFDVVITDLMMPGGIDGMGVLEQVKQKYEETEVILLTAFASVDNAVEAMKLGACDYVTKPISHEELILRLEKILTLKSVSEDADNLRVAIDVTQKGAAETIRSLETLVARHRKSFDSIKQTVEDADKSADEKLKSLEEIIASVSSEH